MMKICLDLRYKTESGASHYIKNIVPLLIKYGEGNEFTLIKYRNQSLGFEKTHDIIYAPDNNGLSQIFWTVAVLPFILKKRKIDIYHTLKNPGPLWNFAKNIHTVHSISGAYNGVFPTTFTRYLYHNLYSDFFIKKCERLIAISDFIYDYVREDFKLTPEKIDLIYHGVDDKFRRIGEEEKIKETLDNYNLPRSYILSVGNITPVKNHKTAVSAFAEIAGLTRLNLVIAGGKYDPYFQTVYNTAKDKGILNRVIFPGFIDNNDMPAVMSRAVMMMFPSLTEGCPVTMLEALKCGLPVVASRRGGLCDLGKDCALFVDDPMNHSAFAEQMKRILFSESLQKELKGKAMKKADQLTWDKTAIATLETYKRAYNVNYGKIYEQNQCASS